jgi:hypothetical protein
MGIPPVSYTATESVETTGISDCLERERETFDFPAPLAPIKMMFIIVWTRN